MAVRGGIDHPKEFGLAGPDADRRQSDTVDHGRSCGVGGTRRPTQALRRTRTRCGAAEQREFAGRIRWIRRKIGQHDHALAQARGAWNGVGDAFDDDRASHTVADFV